MSKLRMKAVRQLNEKDLKDRLVQLRTDLKKLDMESSKGTLRKESGNLRPTRRNIARILTRVNELKKND